MFGPTIFWTSSLLVVLILMLATLLGRVWSTFFPYKLQPLARFFLAPALGLATLVVFTSIVGRWVPFGDSVLIPFLFFALLSCALIKEQNLCQAFSHALIVAAFGIVCGVSVLASLYFFGGFNAHNDAFTYLVHSDWLQHHIFTQLIPSDQIVPATTQVALYQQAGLRMGASFLLAFFQSLLNVRWAYEIYPAVNISAMAVCFLAMGFPLFRMLRRLSRPIQLIFLSLPAFSVGGIMFGANFGFLPQTVGLGLGAAMLFAVGPVLKQLTYKMTKPYQICFLSAIPLTMLLAASVYAYSELAPFLGLTLFISGLVMIFFVQNKKYLIACLGFLLVFSVLFLNAEILRMFSALRAQSGAIVGKSVDWTLLGFVAHALGFHGGAWDLFQWTDTAPVQMRYLILGVSLMLVATALFIFSFQRLKKNLLNGTLITSVVILAIFALGILYFRYFVPTPFPTGTGQSWSQFKLANWAHPFAMLLLLFALLSTRRYLGKWFNGLVIFLLIVVFCTSVRMSKMRMWPLMDYYKGVSNLDQYYRDFRRVVLQTCAGKPVYLALGGSDHKFRQMAVLFLRDQEVKSDWMDDGYIYPHLSQRSRTQNFMLGECMVEPLGSGGFLKKGTVLGPVRVGHLEEGGVKLGETKGAYDREHDSENWWRWVEHKVTFKLEPYLISAKSESKNTRIHLEYQNRGSHKLTLKLKGENGKTSEQTLPLGEEGLKSYDAIINLSPGSLTELSIESEGEPIQLGVNDSRKASFMVRNLRVSQND